MKKISAVMVMGFFLLTTNISVRAQGQNNSAIQVNIIEPYPLTITYSKTTNIIFPYAIISVDRGSKDVLAQKAGGVQNVLQLKAAKQGFQQTNVAVITADGKLTSFLIDYAENPTVLNLSFTAEQMKASIPILSKTANQEEIQKYTNQASASKEKITGVKDKRYGIRMRWNGLFVHDSIMYFRLSIANKTNINYHVDQLRLYIHDQKKAKSTAAQELEITPLYVQGDTSVITGQTERTLVYAIPKFTIPDKKYLAIELMEENGGRHLQLKVKNPKIIKALLIE